MLFNRIIDEQEILSDWKISLIVKIPKKGDFTICDNHRVISLLSVPSNFFCSVVIDRIRDGINDKLKQEQAAYRRGKGKIRAGLHLKKHTKTVYRMASNFIHKLNKLQESL